MGVYIPNMEMPKFCGECRFSVDGWCYVIPEFERQPGAINKTGKTRWCPLVPVPPHGRLIDADAFIANQRHLYCENCDRRRGMKDGKLTKRFVYAIGDAPCRACDTGDMLDYVDDAPTIIPAEGENS